MGFYCFVMTNKLLYSASHDGCVPTYWSGKSVSDLFDISLKVK